jgi:hypothetical protein
MDINSQSHGFDTSSHTGWIWPVVGAVKAAAQATNKLVSSLTKSTIKSNHKVPNNTSVTAATVEAERAACITRIQAALRKAGAKGPEASPRARPTSGLASNVGPAASDQARAETHSEAQRAMELRANAQRQRRPQAVGAGGAAARRINIATTQGDARVLC